MAKSRLPKSTVKDLKLLRMKLSSLIDEFGNPKRMKILGLEAIRIIRVRTRTGEGFTHQKKAGGGSTSNLKPLSDNYKEFRTAKKKLLDKTAKPSKSNLTFTGQLLRSIDVTKVRKGSVFIGAKREARTDIYGKNSKIKNSEVIYEQTKQGRIFLQLSDLDIKKLLRFMTKLVRADIRRKKLK